MSDPTDEEKAKAIELCDAAVESAHPLLSFDEAMAKERAARDAIAQSIADAREKALEEAGPVWKDAPNAEGWWLRRTRGGATTWHLLKAGPAPLAFMQLPKPQAGDRWLGPIAIPEDK